jgi:HEAT repeat protein
MKKRCTVLILLACGALAGAPWFLRHSTPAHAHEVLIQGRPVADWVNEVEVGGFPGRQNAAQDVLVSSGLRALSDLCHLLVVEESAKDLAMRIRFVPADVKNRHASTSQRLLLKAKAAAVIGIIAYQNPSAPEVGACIPFLTTALGSGSREVRFLAAQALGAIGKGATNAVPRLVSKTSDEDSGVRMCAVEALGRIGTASPLVMQALTNALADTNNDVSITAKLAVQTLTRQADAHSIR